MHLPASLAEHFAAANTEDIDRIAACFAEDATVEDEKEQHVGRAAIHRWAAEARRRYGFRAEPFRVEGDVRNPVVHAHVLGDFPGSPVDLTYRFAIADGAIAALSIR